jgi:hypothetical protein
MVFTRAILVETSSNNALRRIKPYINGKVGTNEILPGQDKSNPGYPTRYRVDGNCN